MKIKIRNTKLPNGLSGPEIKRLAEPLVEKYNDLLGKNKDICDRIIDGDT